MNSSLSFDSPSSNEWKWRADPDFFLALRSNVADYWEWSSHNASKILPPELLKYQGFIEADDHYGQQGPVEISQSKYFWSFVDFDDSGVGPFVLNIAMNAIRAQAQNIDGLFAVDLITSFQEGLSNHKHTKPKIVEKLENLSDEKLEEKYKKFLAKMVSNNDRFNYEENTDFLPLTHHDHLDEFKSALPDKEILDMATRVKTTGGSQGLTRYLFLLKGGKGRYHIYEFKPLLDRAGISYYQTQKDSPQRIAESMEFFWENRQSDDYKIVKIGEKWYFMRPRLPHYFKINSDEDFAELTAEDQREYMLYIANIRGLNAARQLSKSDREAFYQAIEDHKKSILTFINEYFQAAKLKNKQ